MRPDDFDCMCQVCEVVTHINCEILEKMRFVLNLSEVANALQVKEPELRSLLPQLYENGFPQPIKVLSERWSIFDVMNWVNKQNDDTEKSTPMQRTVPSPLVN
jgi:predicted DNA-binding transcriptional regulator AlpA